MMIKMKKIYILLLCSTLLSTGCKSDWLEQDPTTGGSSSQVVGSVQNSKMSINGMASIMYMHYFIGNGYNGEGTVMSFMGDCMGNDYIYTRNENAFRNGENGLFNVSNTAVWDYFPWTYYYDLIMNANTLLESIDKASGDAKQRMFVKAQALTFRAHAYSRLVELYGDAWDISNNGSTLSVVLRTSADNNEMPLSSLADVYEQIYTDLNEACDLFDNSNLKKSELYTGMKTDIAIPDASVAHAVFARAALNRKDYSTALAQAKLARKDHPLMSVADYRMGFSTPNSEWIWGGYSDREEYLDYSSNLSWMAYNSSDALARFRAPVASRDLIDIFADSDIRKNLFIHKGIYNDGKDDMGLFTTAEASLGKFANTEITGKVANTPEDAYQAYLKAQEYANNYVDKYANGYKAPTIIFPYTALKFNCSSNGDAYNTGSIPFIRSSEMVLIEAEANYFLKDEDAARSALVELNRTSGRDPEYTCTKSGDELFEEIVNYRRLELWGEGHGWFDCKRWHRPVVRRPLTQGGSFILAISGTLGEDVDDTFWKWCIPSRELEHNSMIK